MQVWLYAFPDCTRACLYRCYGDVICVDNDMNRYSGWWYVCSVNIKYRCGMPVLN